MNWNYFGARYYDPQIGRWMVVDPVHANISLAPYVYSRNNPINFFDPNGETEYTFHIRSFHPNRYFGLGFHGDERGFSNQVSLGITSRVHQSFTLDTEQGILLNPRTRSDYSLHPLGFAATRGAWGFDVGTPSESFSDVGISGNTFAFSSEYAGPNPLLPIAVIDVSSSFAVTEDKKAGLLSISASITGDAYPNAEAFIVDPHGNSLFIGAFTRGGGSSPFWSLFGKGDKQMIKANFQIKIGKDGKFLGILYKGKEYSIDKWNEQFLNQPKGDAWDF